MLKQYNILRNLHWQCKNIYNYRSYVTQLRNETQMIYENHANIEYSSYLEQQAFNSHLQELRKRKHDKFGMKTRQAGSSSSSAGFRVTFPKFWMEDYEFYAGAKNDQSGTVDSLHGTADATIRPSNVPCNGCGAHLHCASTALPGYIPKEIFDGRSKKELQTIICQRCHFLKEYNIALDVQVTPDTYIQTIACIQDDFALALVIVDLLDLPCSIWPQMHALLGRKRPVFIVGNKVDLLPKDSRGYLERVKQCLQTQVLQSGFDELNIKYFGLISAKTGFGIEELITQLQKQWQTKGNVYLMGCTNVGKSSLFNILLNSDYCRPEATDLIRKATACPWPGTTLNLLKFPILRPSDIRVYMRFQRLYSERAQNAAEHKLLRLQAMETGNEKYAKAVGKVGRTFSKRLEDSFDSFQMSKGTQPITTFDERNPDYAEAKWCYDTPGVMHPDQITNELTAQELLLLEQNAMIVPRAVRLPIGMSLFLAGLGRLDLIQLQNDKDWLKLYIFASKNVPILIVNTTVACDVYKKYLGNEIMGLPCGDEERLAKWPGLLAANEEIIVQGEGDKMQETKNETNTALAGDIVLSSAGWIGLELPFGSEASFKAWTPFARGIHLRKPALVPYASRLVGKRIKNSLAYNTSKPFTFQK